MNFFFLQKDVQYHDIRQMQHDLHLEKHVIYLKHLNYYFDQYLDFMIYFICHQNHLIKLIKLCLLHYQF